MTDANPYKTLYCIKPHDDDTKLVTFFHVTATDRYEIVFYTTKHEEIEVISSPYYDQLRFLIGQIAGEVFINNLED